MIISGLFKTIRKTLSEREIQVCIHVHYSNNAISKREMYLSSSDQCKFARKTAYTDAAEERPDVTPVGPFVIMDLKMAAEVRKSSESLCTHGARVRPTLIVDFVHMSFQRCLMAKGIEAYVTLVGLFTRVDQPVPLKP